MGLTVIFPKAGLAVGGGVGEDSSDGELTIVAGGEVLHDYYGNEISAQNGVLSGVDDEPDVTSNDITNPDGPGGGPVAVGGDGPTDGYGDHFDSLS
eukprot:scaffold6754_cov127-Skeletonema_dohrnii-CCMP3373.AAC.7